MRDRKLTPVITSLALTLVSYAASAGIIIWGLPALLESFSFSRYSLPGISIYAIEISDYSLENTDQVFSFYVPLAFLFTALIQSTAWYIRSSALLVSVTLLSLLPLLASILACMLPFVIGD